MRSVARVGLLLADDHAEERRLARAVGADDADDAAGRQDEVQVVDQQVVAVALAQALGLDHQVAEARPGRDRDLARRPRASRPPAPRPAAPRSGRGAPCSWPAAPAAPCAPTPARARSVRRRADSSFSSCAEPVLLLLEPGRVVALPRDAGAAVELEDPAGHVVEEVAVVGHGDHRARILLEVPLEPGDRLGVEVVGRLVEEQHVGRLQQQAAERHAPPLAAGERRHVGVARRQAQRVHGDLERGGRAPSASAASIWSWTRPCSAISLSISASGRSSPSFIDSSSKRSSRLRAAGPPPRRARARPCSASSCGSCGRKPTRVPSAGKASPAKSLSIAGHDAQQRALAGAVRPEHADLRARDRTTARSRFRISLPCGVTLRRSFMVKMNWGAMAYDSVTDAQRRGRAPIPSASRSSVPAGAGGRRRPASVPPSGTR